MKKRIVIFESEGGSDKWIDGHRKDTVPILNALKKRGWHCEVIFYRDEWKTIIVDYVKNDFDAYISRINPGSLPDGETIYFETLNELLAHGLKGMPTPQAMLNFGAKDILVKLMGSKLVLPDTFSYYDSLTFREKFPISLSYGDRVLKQNRGSTGEGIWRVSVESKAPYSPGDALPLNTLLKCTEAVDNHVEYYTLQDFMAMCEKYLEGINGMLVDMRFLSRIKEGEIRIMMVGELPIFIVHKKPADAKDAFSATLFSGATYTYEPPQKWPKLMRMFKEELPKISSMLGDLEIPLIWTADFMLNWDEEGHDSYVLGEINCSCVGFTSHIDDGIQDIIAEEVISRIQQKV